MLYVSTRDNSNSFSYTDTLQENYAPDGGLFVPAELPSFSRESIASVMEMSFAEAVATVLNLFFSTNLNGWDIDFCAGRYPIKLIQSHHRLLIAEVWHNPEASYSLMERSIYARLINSKLAGKAPTLWAKIAIRTAIYFGLFSEAARLKICSFDTVVNSADFSAVMAALYAKKMGLPIEMIICSCNENTAVWDLIHRSECYTSISNHAKQTNSRIDLSLGIEQLIYSLYGPEEAVRFTQISAKAGIYKLNESFQGMNTLGFHAAVISNNRVDSIMRSFYQASNYIADIDTAVTYGGLQDFRARTGESRTTLLLSENTPLHSLESISSATGISAEEIKKRIIS